MVDMGTYGEEPKIKRTQNQNKNEESSRVTHRRMVTKYAVGR